MYETQVEHVPALKELASYPQWVAWEYREKRTKKAPINPHTWRDASPTDPSTWGSYEEARFSAGSREQIGFVFSADDPFTGVDLDDCIVDGEVMPWANEIVKSLDSYTEISPSGTGLKIWVRGRKPGDSCVRQYETGKVEIFDSKRFFAFTGRVFQKDSIEERQDELERLYYKLFPRVDKDEINTGGVGSGDGFTGQDAELLEKARKASGTGKVFSKLYDSGDTSMYKYDHSKADMALCGMLAFWTGRDEERMDRLFRGSKLMREKWDERRGSSTYGANTIALAIKNCENVYDTDYKVAVKDDVYGILEGSFEHVVHGSWGGRSGPIDRDVYKALINTGVVYGRKVKDGVEVCASIRDLALSSGVGRRATVSNALKRLEHRGLIRKVDDGGPSRASRYILLTQNRTINNRVNKYGTPMSQTQRIRNPGRTYGTIGKRNAQIIDYIYFLGRVVTLEELEKHLRVRKNNLKARYMNLLVELELLEEKDDGYVTRTDIEERLQRELEGSGQLEAEKFQREKYKRERRAWRRVQQDFGEEDVKLVKEDSNPTVFIEQSQFPDNERDYVAEEDLCIHGLKADCYLHNPNHPYRKVIAESEKAVA